MLVSFVRCGSKGRNRVAVEGGLGACTLGSSPTRNPGLWAGIPLGFTSALVHPFVVFEVSAVCFSLGLIVMTGWQ